MIAPVEVIDAIALCISSPRDLLSLALTCKHVAGVLVPRHTQYRVIRCSPLRGFNIWTQLQDNKSLAKNVRAIHIQDDTGLASPPFQITPRHPPLPDRIPSAFISLQTPQSMWQKPNYIETTAERALIAALRNMTKLESFTWTALPPLVYSSTQQDSEDIWTILGSSTNVSHLDVVDYDTEGTWYPRSPIHDSTVSLCN